MTELLRKPFGTHGKVHDITPESAGWRYVGLRAPPASGGRECRGVTGSPPVMGHSSSWWEGKGRSHPGGAGLGHLGRADGRLREGPAAFASTCRTARTGRCWRKRTAPLRSARPRAGAVMMPAGSDPTASPSPERRQGREHPPYQQHRDGDRGLRRQPPRHGRSSRRTDTGRPTPATATTRTDFPRITYLEETYYHRLKPEKTASASSGVYTDDGPP